MAWTVAVNERVDDPRVMGWTALLFPPTPAVVAYAVRYVPDTPVPVHWSRVGFVFVSVVVEGQRLSTTPETLAAASRVGQNFFHILTADRYSANSTLLGRSSQFAAQVQLVEYARPGQVQLLVLT